MVVIVDKQKIKNLEPFLPLIERQAERWETVIFAQICSGDIREPVYDNEIHLFIYATPHGHRQLVTLSKAFGLNIEHYAQIPNFYNVDLPVTEKIEKQTQELIKREKRIISPEGNVIAVVLDNNIYICFDIIWANNLNHRIIFDQILEESLFLVMESYRKSGDEKSLSCDVVAEKLRGELLKNSLLEEEFLCLHEKFFEENLRKIDRDLEKHRMVYKHASGTLPKVNFRLEILNETLDNLEFQTNYDDYLREFEILLKMPQIRGIEIEKNNNLKVFTRKIISNNIYDIGEYQIVIDLNYSGADARKAISFIKGPYVGKYEHPHAQKYETCFGTQFLNYELDQLFREGDIFHIICWCIIFLESIERKGSFLIAHQSSDAPEEYKDEKFYQSKLDWKREQKKYAETLKSFREIHLKRQIKAEIEEFQKEAEKLRDILLKTRQNIKYCFYFKSYLERIYAKESLRHRAEYNEILKLEGLVDLKIDSDVVRVLFSLRDGSNKIAGFLDLWVDLDLRNVFTRPIVITLAQIKLLDKTPLGIEETFWSLLDNGKFREAVLLWKNHIA